MAVIKIEDLAPLEALSAEQLEEIVGAGRRPLGVEKLEGREVPATLLAAGSATSLFTAEPAFNRPSSSLLSASSDVVITGTNNADTVDVTRGLLGGVNVRFNGVTSTFNNVRNIVFQGRGGDDFFINNTNIPALARGGAGNDILIGGTADDMLFGDAGMDGLFGREGNDTLFGASDAGGYEGRQSISLTGPFNALFGGAGNDKIYGSSTRDLLGTGTGQDVAIGFEGGDVRDAAFTPTGSTGTAQTWRSQMFGDAPNQGGYRFKQGLMDGGDSTQISDSSSDVQRSDGSQSIRREEKYTNSDGSTTTIVSTHNSDGKGNSSESQEITHTDAKGQVTTEKHTTDTSSNGTSREAHSSGGTQGQGTTLPGMEGSSRYISVLRTQQPGVKTVPATRQNDPRVINPNPTGETAPGGTVDAGEARRVGLSRLTTPEGASSGVTIRRVPDLNGGRQVIDPRLARPTGEEGILGGEIPGTPRGGTTGNS